MVKNEHGTEIPDHIVTKAKERSEVAPGVGRGIKIEII